ncbi:hypothetical protein IMF27_25160 [Pseudomonas sp. PCH199]|uniref:hypothetical protein n=1 Tax=unclassified Pseudomonas TaxID=196821 RepID=UPI000BD3B171|nr:MULTISPECIES: hypothetical protein [unclassified Pseudomonas]MCW8278442.1 hypothetical protein [Pseudomonas sp. PCH199]PAM81373.1 hypothetical protein CES87_25695 [Pseudomonas sp. ERMR1:02]
MPNATSNAWTLLCDREAIGWVASPTGYSGDDIRDLMLESVEKRFGDQLPATPGRPGSPIPVGSLALGTT